GGFGGGRGAALEGVGGGGAGMGGAIFNAAGALIITNSTLAGNTAQGGGGWHNGSGYGGAVFNLNGRLTLTNNTLASNEAVSAGGGLDPGGWGDGAGGALYTLGLDGVVAYVGGPTIGNAADAQVILNNTLLVNNVAQTVFGAILADLFVNNSTV